MGCGWLDVHIKLWSYKKIRGNDIDIEILISIHSKWNM